MFGLRNALFLEQLSSDQCEFVKAAEEKRMHMTDSEYKLLQKRVKSILNTEELKDSSTAEEGAGDEDSRGQTLASQVHKKTDVKDKAQFKRKRAKVGFPYTVINISCLFSCFHHFCIHAHPSPNLLWWMKDSLLLLLYVKSRSS